MSSTLKHERRILAALIENLSAAGFKPAAVWTEDCYVMPGSTGEVAERTGTYTGKIVRPMTGAEVAKVFDDYDLYAPTVHFTDQHKTTWGNHGVMVVPGNGSDFISDWHCSDKAFNAIVEQVAEAAAEEVYS